ncbi:ATP/GTP-binding protein [Streptomyces sp. Ru73]|uniref:tetratricopeptide repeat protein n=1 Tax=Streptomyces sp. Ru73 TaxID=2080748 RepID=UPI000CDE3856|nr:tetratricopeptide repeat protein [Streptomyces sp. Ru73]POX37582.1 ATP/GTP-binding protein [Streptomyces sp. Ru73]
MNSRNDAQASHHGRVYQASGDQHIVEHHHYDPVWAAPDSVRRPAVGRFPEVLRDRAELMEHLRAAVASGGSNQVYVLHGLGGCGKTAVACALFSHATTDGGQVGLWVNASDVTSLRTGMLAVAADRGASDGELTAARSGLRAAADLVWDRLDRSDRPWLLVIDNADDPAVLREGSWLRSSPRGTVLVTTRQAAARWWPGAELLHVGVLPRNDAAKVLCDLAPEAGTAEEAAEIADRLGRLPLALTLAGTFLAHQVIDPWTMTQYSHHLDGGRTTDTIALIDQGAAVLGADSRHLVSRTWQLSLDTLANHGAPEAHTLLRLLACWAGDPLPLSLLAGVELGSDLPAERVEPALRGLLDHSLTELLTGTPRFLRTHGVLLDSVAGRTPTEQHEPLITKAAEVLLDSLPAVPERGAQAADFTPLVPHVLALLRRTVQWGDVDGAIVEKPAECSVRLALALHRAGDYGSALALGERSVDLLKMRLSGDHPLVLRLRQRIGRTLSRLGRFEEAETMLRETLADCERSLGPNALDTLESCLSLSSPLYALGQTSESVELIKRTVAGRSKTLGPVHPLTLLARRYLLSAPPGPGLEEEARKGAALLSDCRLALGQEHSITLTVEHQYAHALLFTGRPAEALPHIQKAFAAHKERYGSDYPVTLSVQSLLSQALAQLGDMPEAIQHAEEVARRRLRVLGPEHPWTLIVQERVAQYRSSRNA